MRRSVISLKSRIANSKNWIGNTIIKFLGDTKLSQCRVKSYRGGQINSLAKLEALYLFIWLLEPKYVSKKPNAKFINLYKLQTIEI